VKEIQLTQGFVAVLGRNSVSLDYHLPHLEEQPSSLFGVMGVLQFRQG
jgi:hypothetical protein